MFLFSQLFKSCDVILVVDCNLLYEREIGKPRDILNGIVFEDFLRFRAEFDGIK